MSTFLRVVAGFASTLFTLSAIALFLKYPGQILITGVLLIAAWLALWFFYTIGKELIP